MERQEDFDDEWDAVYEPAAKPAPAPASAARPSLASNVQPQALPEARSAQPQQPVAVSSPWDDHAIPHRGRLNAFPAFASRSALFKAANASGDYDQLTAIKAQGASLQCSGPKLDMRDKQVWEIAIELAKQRAGHIGDRFEIELREFARRMGNDNPNSRALSSIWNSLTKLALVRVVFSLKGGSMQGVGSLIATVARDGNRLYLRLNPEFALPALLCDLQFEMNTPRRSKISSALGQWLHDFYSTHAEPMPIDLGYLMKLSGYEGPAKNFPAKLRSAMKELVEIAPEVVCGYSIKEEARSCESWILEAELGAEKRAYQAAKRLPAASSKSSGKVAL